MRRVLLATALLFGALLGQGTAGAHAQYKPFSLNRYAIIAFEPPGIRISYNVTVGDLPAQRLRKRFDADGDGQISRAEFEAMVTWARGQISGGLSVELDGEPVQVVPGDQDVDLVSNQVEMFAPIWFRFYVPVPCEPGRHKLVYKDESEFPELGQTELFIRQARHVRMIRAGRPQRDRGVVDRMFWEDGQPPGPVWVSFELGAPGQVLSQPGAARADAPTRPPEDEGAGLKRALADERLGVFGLLAALGLAFLLGAAHALSPGHGKTLVAAYLVGSKGTVRHALVLGGIVTTTHVLSVVVLGLIALWASESVVPERLTPWIALVAGGLVVAMGAWMLWRRLRGPGHHHHDHHGHQHDHDHPDAEADHGHHPPSGEVRWGELLGLGITGGLVPCPSATVVLLFAIYVGRIGLGLALIGAFSLGLAASLVVVGVLVVRGRKLLERLSAGPVTGRLARSLPLLSALAVCAVGLIMTGLAIYEL